MLYWAAIFFVVAIIAAAFGFGGIAAGAAGIAKILFFIFVIVHRLSACRLAARPRHLISRPRIDLAG